MKILVACEESQAVTIELRKLGHEAYSCDIEPCSGGHPEWHIQDDVLSYIDPTQYWETAFLKSWPLCIPSQDNAEIIELPQRWDMIIAFPPCTYLSNAGACRLYPKKGQLNQERYEKGLEAKEFFMKLLNAPCDKVAVENPVSSRVFEMPKHSQEIQPYEYGHPHTKKTRLWLKGLPFLDPTNIVEPTGPYVPAGTSRKDRSKYGAAKRGNDRKNRSKTFIGIAKAMAEQWAGKDI